MTNAITKALTEDINSVVAITTVVALVLTATTPLAIKRRLRFVFVMALVYMSFAVVRRILPTPGALGFDLRVIKVLCGTLAAARLIFVVAVDLIVERVGRHPMNRLPRDVGQGALMLAATIIALRATGIAAGSILTTGTVITAVVGLSLQETLGNLAAGVAMQIEKPLEVGEWVRLDKGDVMGRVVATNWRGVTIETDDRSQLMVPNGVLSKTPFMNFSRPGGSFRRNLYITIPFEVSPTRVEAAIRAACGDVPEVLSKPPLSILTWSYTERGIQYWLRFYIADFTTRDRVQGLIGTRIWYHLHREKIPQGIPQQRLDIFQVDEQAKAGQEAETLADRRAAIDGVDFLRPLSEASKELLATRGHRKLFAPGETIIRQGDVATEFFMVRRGKVSIHVDGLLVRDLLPGNFFGELALLTGTVRKADVTAAIETEIFGVDQSVFRDVLQREPAVGEQISRIVAEREADNVARQSGSEATSQQVVISRTEEIFSRVKNLFGI